MENESTADRAKRRKRTGIGELKGLPSDLFGWSRIDTSAQGRGHNLCAKTNAEGGPSGAKATGNKFNFCVEEGVGLAFVDANRSAEHNNEVVRYWVNVIQRAYAGIEISHLVAAIVEYIFEEVKCSKPTCRIASVRIRTNPFVRV